MRSIGIDITKKSLMIVEISADSSSFEILRGEQHSLPLQDETNWDIEVLQTLIEYGKKYDFENTPVTIALPQHLTSLRELKFPFHRRSDIFKSLPFELEEEIPYDIEDALFDGKIIATTPSETILLSYTAKVDSVLEKIEFLSKAKIDPEIISVESCAFANLYENWGQGSFLLSAPDTIPAPLTLRIYVRDETSLVTVFHGQQMVWTRSIFWGEKNMALELTQKFNIPYDQALQLIPAQLSILLSPAGATSEQMQVSAALEHSLTEFIQQIKLSILDIEDRLKSKVETILLSGPVASVENITAHITKNVGVAVQLESFAGDIFKPKQVEKINYFVESAAIAVGLAIEGCKRPKNPPLNLRRGIAAKRNVFWEKTWAKWRYTAALCAIGYIFYFVYGVAREQIAFHLDEITYEQLQKHAGTIANLRGREASPERIEKYLKNEEEKNNNAKLFEKVQDIEPAMKVVNTLSSVLPSNKNMEYEIKTVDVKDSVIRIEGQAAQQNTINQIRKKLESMPHFNKVVPFTPSLKANKGIAFAFKVTEEKTEHEKH